MYHLYSLLDGLRADVEKGMTFVSQEQEVEGLGWTPLTDTLFGTQSQLYTQIITYLKKSKEDNKTLVVKGGRSISVPKNFRVVNRGFQNDHKVKYETLKEIEHINTKFKQKISNMKLVRGDHKNVKQRHKIKNKELEMTLPVIRLTKAPQEEIEEPESNSSI